MTLTRGAWLRAAGSGLLIPSFTSAQTPEDAIVRSKHPKMLVHSRRPANIEAPVELLDSWITPIDRFYVPRTCIRPRGRSEMAPESRRTG